MISADLMLLLEPVHCWLVNDFSSTSVLYNISPAERVLRQFSCMIL